MTGFAICRILQSVALIALTSVAVFFGLHLIGDPVAVLAGPQCVGECRREVVRQFGLDRPLYEQYLSFAANALHGDLGKSYSYGESAMGMIFERLPATLELALCAMVLAIGIGVPLGIWAGLRPKTISSRIITAGSILGFSMPVFWQGIMLILLFAVWRGWLPATGRGKTVDVLGIHLSLFTADGLAHLLLPAVNLSLVPMALVIRLCRSGTREIALQDYIKFARAKGLRPSRIVLVHILRNISIPIVTVVGLEFGTVIGFALVTESVYAWPGIGKLAIDAIQSLDRPLIISYILFTVVMFITINLTVDIAVSLLDPRIRLREAR